MSIGMLGMMMTMICEGILRRDVLNRICILVYQYTWSFVALKDVKAWLDETLLKDWQSALAELTIVSSIYTSSISSSCLRGMVNK